MSVTRLRLIASESTDQLEKQVNHFLSQEDVEVKQVDYQTNGYEKPYSMAILYHEKVSSNSKQSWRGRVFGSKV